MPAVEYFSLPILSNSDLRDFEVAPQKYRWTQDNPKPPTVAMVIGSATHCHLLEPPERFEAEFLVAPECRLNTKAGKAEFDEWLMIQIEDSPGHQSSLEDPGEVREAYLDWKSPQKTTTHKQYEWLIRALGGRQILRQDDMKRINGMTEAIWNNESASRVLGSLDQTEVSVLWEFCGKPFKSRIDGISAEKRWALDLKCVSAGSASPEPEGFPRKVWNMKYHRQAGLYAYSLDQVAPELEIDQFLFLAVEQTPPHLLCVYSCNSDMLHAGVLNGEHLVTNLQGCESCGLWPGYADEIVDLNLPAFGWKKVQKELEVIGV